MKKLTILVDMDDTIENLLVEWLNVLNERYHCTVTPDDIRSWNIQEAYPKLTDAQVHAPLFTEELWKAVRPKWDAVRWLERLQKDGHDIYITTSSNFDTIRIKVHSILDRYFPYIPMDHVIVASKKQMIRGDVMIDDAPHNLLGFEGAKIMMDAPHNRSFSARGPEAGISSSMPGFRLAIGIAEEHLYCELADDIIRVRNWAEIYTLVTDYARKLGDNN